MGQDSPTFNFSCKLNEMEEKKKKILYIITKASFGGAQRYVYDLATNIPQDKFEVAVALGGEGGLKDKLIESGIRVITINNLERDISASKDLSVFFELINIIKTERPDVVHLNSSKIGGLGALATRITSSDARIIFTGHGWAFNESRSAVSKIIIGALHFITILLSHKTIAVSQATREQIDIFPFIKNKLEVIHNGLGKIDFLDRESSRRTLLKDEVNKIWIGTISELHKNKGLDIAIKAFKEISRDNSQAIFVIIGDGEERIALEKLIRELDLTGKVFLLGRVNEASKYLKAFDIFTLTSRTEALPYVILEAGAAGLPVVATKVGGVPEIIENGVSGLLIEPKNEIEIANALSTLLLDKQLSTSFGVELKQKIDQEFSLNKMIGRTTDLY